MIIELLLCALPVQDPVQAVTRELPDGTVLVYEARVGAEGDEVRHGSYQSDSPAGARIRGEYFGGNRTGRWRAFFENGAKRANGEYRRNERHGDWKFGHPTRKARAEGEFKKGQPAGLWSFWDADGKVDAHNSGVYVASSRIHANGDLQSFGVTLDGALHGPWEFTWPDGTKQLEAEFDRGKRVGTWRLWHSDGTLDLEFLSGTYDSPKFFSGLFVDSLLEPVELATEAAPAEETVPDPPRMQLVDDGSAEARRAGEGEALDQIISDGRQSLPAILGELKGLDYESDDGRARALFLIEELVEPILGGHSLGREGPDSSDVRRAALRAHSLFALCNDDAWWLIELPGTPHGPACGDTEQSGCTFLLKPNFPSGPKPASQPTVDGLPDFGASGVMGVGGQAGGKFGARRGGRRNLRARGGAGTERALKDGLEWLALHQDEDGLWDADGFMKHDPDGEACDGPGDALHDIGLTSLALLAFFGDGNTPLAGPYKQNVVRGLAWLRDQQDPETGLFGKQVGQGYVYDHALATIAVCEAYHFTMSPLLGGTAQNAVDFIVRARNPDAVWRYSYPPSGDNDTSVTSWMFFALSAARDAGLKVDPEAFGATLTWLERVTDSGTGRVGYDAPGSFSARVQNVNTDFPPEQGEAMTAAGLLCRFFLGQDPGEQPIMTQQAELLLRRLPEWDPEAYGCDMYYWYYGSYAMYQMGGKSFWKPWNTAMKKALLDNQRKDGSFRGSWDPVGPWGYAGGRLYSTAMMCLCLEVYFRYTLVPEAR